MLRIVTTNHSAERLREFHLPYWRMRQLVETAIEVKPIHGAQYKAYKYGEANSGVVHLQNGPWVFTVKNVVQKSGEEVILLITVFDQRMSLKEQPPGEGQWTR